jgi:hypothetical protein
MTPSPQGSGAANAPATGWRAAAPRKKRKTPATSILRSKAQMKKWIDEQYRFLMLAGMFVEIALIAYLCFK